MRRRLGLADAIPTSLWGYAFLGLIGTLVGLVLRVGEHPLVSVGVVPVYLVFAWFVLRGSRVVWSFVCVSIGSGLILLPVWPLPWWSVAIDVVSLAFLLAPSSRKFVWRPRPRRPSGRLPSDPDGSSDASRTSGWYLDPNAPGRMRYWRATDGRWLGSARIPRRLKRGRADATRDEPSGTSTGVRS